MPIPIRPKPTPQANPAPAAKGKISFAPINERKGQRAVLYGTGGVGKTLLACLAPGEVAFVDADESLPVLLDQLTKNDIDIPRIVPANDWASLRSSLQTDGWDKIKTIVLDTSTKIEEWAVAHTLATVPHEKGHKVKSVEDYGYGKGLQFVFDTFLPLLGDLDRHVRAGRNVILIAHECTTNVPNPAGDDWIRYEPRMQSPNSGKASIRHRLKEWADHVLFLSYDVAVDKKTNKAQGSGTRTLYCAELPSFMAKSRTTDQQFSVTLGESPWAEIFK